MFTVWHRLFSLVLAIPGLRIESTPLFTVQGKCIYKIINAENKEIKLLLLSTKPIYIYIYKYKFSSFQDC